MTISKHFYLTIKLCNSNMSFFRISVRHHKQTLPGHKSKSMQFDSFINSDPGVKNSVTVVRQNGSAIYLFL